ncbi:MAG: hypothetical protein QE278_03880 [Limnobacter sp.]|nr:hypothetical protein [Limnobacter sp.]
MKKYFFEPDFMGTALFIKATAPTKVKAIEWTTPHYTKAPCHSWDDINPDDIYRFDTSTKK